jgi:uncharacterized repeat protein (TIGR04076 family)
MALSAVIRYNGAESPRGRDMMAESYTVTITLVSNNRPCHAGHQIGQAWSYDYLTPAGMCSSAWHTVYPWAMAIASGGVFTWQENPDVMRVSCPDCEVQNVFELRRVPRRTTGA